jgi:hypothetical protein
MSASSCIQQIEFRKSSRSILLISLCIPLECSAIITAVVAVVVVSLIHFVDLIMQLYLNLPASQLIRRHFILTTLTTARIVTRSPSFQDGGCRLQK